MNVATNTDGNGHLNCTNATCDCRTRTVDLGLTTGKTYEIAIFGADRHPTGSNLQIVMPVSTDSRTTCTSLCGDGKISGAEECDCGDVTASADPACGGLVNNDLSYGGCTTLCTLGPRCGDGVVQPGAETCDLGTKNNPAGYGQSGCTPGCRTPSSCGDGIVDTTFGEQCDLGSSNGQAGSRCSAACKITSAS
jgi:hypothetical protein